MTSSRSNLVLRVDLSNRRITSEEWDETLMRKFLGGAGLSAHILWNETKADTDPLLEENPLIFAVGPVTGTLFPSNSRYIVAAISPLTNIWGEAHVGGGWPAALRRAGYIAIVIKGKADRPVYIWVNNEAATIVDASHIWGKDAYETEVIIKSETDKQAYVAAIGPAGEKMVSYACIVDDGPKAHVGGRCGMGAVMGSKNLKAVVVAGAGKPWVYDEVGLRESIDRLFPKLRRIQPGEEDPRLKRGFLWVDDRASIRNFQLGEMDSFVNKMGQFYLDLGKGQPQVCPHCRNGCSLSVMREGERVANAELLIPMGSNCLIDDMAVLDKANTITNRYGLDTISAGDTIAFAMECYEKGLLTKDDTDGIELTWGNSEAMLQVLQKICDAEGFGKLLGMGVKRAAEQIGGLAPEYAMHVKGLEISLHDPRSWNHFAIQNATAAIGAGHMDGYHGIMTQGVMRRYLPPAYGYTHLDDEKAKEAYDNPFAVEGPAKLLVWSQNCSALADSLTCCYFLAYPIGWLLMPVEPFGGVQPEHFAEWLGHVTGWKVDLEEVMKVGERIFNLKRLFNVRRGISRKDDTLPARLLTHKRGGHGFAANNLPPLGQMLNEYYLGRGWSEEGIPTQEKLAELGLLELVRSEIPWLPKAET